MPYNNYYMKKKKRRKVKNRLSRTYSVQLREQIRKTVDEANASLQPERRIPVLVAFQVAGRDLRKTRKLHPDVRVFSAARAVNAHISLSSVGKETVAALENSDLLPVGHPKSTRVHAMTASALRASRARWIAADPSIVHEESRALVASALSLYPTSVEAQHAFARIEAADINRMPLWVRVLAASAAHAMTAALGLGGNSSVARRARAQMQRRDRIGRFAFMGGGFSFGIKIDGVFRAISGKVVGMPEGGEGDLVEIDIRGDKDLADGIYTVNSSRGTSSKAILDVDALPEKTRQRAQGTEIDSEAYDIKSLKRMDAPSEFKKKSENNGVISYMTDDAYAVESADGGKSITVRREVGGSLVGKFDDWGKAVSAMGKDQDNYDKYLKTPEGQAELRSGKWDVEVVGDDDVDAPEPSAEPMDLDPSRNITTQVTDAVRDKRKVRFNYGGKERILTPEKISTGEKSGKRNLFGKDGDGNRKSFTLDKIEAPEVKARIPEQDSTSQEPGTAPEGWTTRVAMEMGGVPNAWTHVPPSAEYGEDHHVSERIVDGKSKYDVWRLRWKTGEGEHTQVATRDTLDEAAEAIKADMPNADAARAASKKKEKDKVADAKARKDAEAEIRKLTPDLDQLNKAEESGYYRQVMRDRMNGTVLFDDDGKYVKSSEMPEPPGSQKVFKFADERISSMLEDLEKIENKSPATESRIKALKAEAAYRKYEREKDAEERQEAIRLNEIENQKRAEAEKAKWEDREWVVNHVAESINKTEDNWQQSDDYRGYSEGFGKDSYAKQEVARAQLTDKEKAEVAEKVNDKDKVDTYLGTFDTTSEQPGITADEFQSKYSIPFPRAVDQPDGTVGMVSELPVAFDEGTLDDILEDFAKNFPNGKVKNTGKKSSGGWDIVEYTVPEDEIDKFGQWYRGGLTEDISPEEEKMSDVLREAKPFTDAELQKVIDEINELFEQYDGGALDASDVLDRFGDAIQDVPNNDAIYGDLVRQVENMELRGGTLEKAKSEVEKSVRKNATEEGAVPYMSGEPPTVDPRVTSAESKLEEAQLLAEEMEDSGKFKKATADKIIAMVKSARDEYESWLSGIPNREEGTADGMLEELIDELEERYTRKDIEFPKFDDAIFQIGYDGDYFTDPELGGPGGPPFAVPNTIPKGNGVSISFPLAEYEDDLETFADQVKRANDLGGFVEIDTTPTLEGADAIVVTFDKPRLTPAEANAFLGGTRRDGAFDARFEDDSEGSEREELFNELTKGKPDASYEEYTARQREEAENEFENLSPGEYKEFISDMREEGRVDIGPGMTSREVQEIFVEDWIDGNSLTKEDWEEQNVGTEVSDTPDAEDQKLQSFLNEEFDAMFEVPEGAYKVKIFDPYFPRGKTDESSTDYTDDPSVLSQKFTKEELARALAEAVLPGEDGEQASGAGSLEFDAGEETVPAEALYEAIGSTDFDADMILAGLYDSQLDRDRPQTNMERIQQFKDDMAFSPGDDLAEIIPTMTDPDQVIRDAEARNRTLGRPDRAAAALDLTNTYEEKNEKLKSLADDLIAKQDEGLGYDAGNLPEMMREYLPLSTSSDPDDREAFSGFWGMMMSLDGGSSGPGQLDDSVRQGDGFRGVVYNALIDVNGGDTDAADDAYEELVETYGGMKEFVDGKEAISSGESDLDSKSTAAAFYRLVKAASRPNETPLYRAIGVNSDDPLFETYTTEGSVFGFDARSFTSNEISSAGFGSMMFPAEGDQRRVIFTVAPGEVDSVEAANFSVFAGESEHFGYGTFEVVSVKEVDTLYGKTRGQKDIVVEVRRSDGPSDAKSTGDGVTYSGIESWEKIGGQLGSNEGGTYRDPQGNEYYVKVPKSPSHAQNESLASTFYEELGINATQVSLGFDNGELRIVSPMVQGSTPDFESRLDDQDYINKLKEGFAVDAWLANWDVVGLVYDNVISDSDGNPLRVDPGGSLLWRARGLPKGDAFGDEVVELDTFRDADLNPQSASVFGNMTDEEVRMSAEKLLQITPQRIDELVDSIVTDPKEAATLKTRLKRRRDYILESQGITGPLDAPRPLDVDGNEIDRPELPDDITDEAAMSDYKDRLADFEVGKAVAEVWDCTEGGGLTAAGKKKCTVPTVDELVEKVNADTAEVAPDTKAEAQELVDDVDNFIAERLEEDGLKTTQKSRLESLKKAISDINAKIQSGKISKKAAIDELNDIADGIQIGGDSDFSDTLATIQDIVVDFRKIIDGTINDRPPSKDLPPPGSGKGYAKDGTTFLVPGMRVRTKWGYGGTVDRYDKNSWQVWVTMDIDPAGKFAPGAKKMSFATKTLDAINQGDDNAPWVDLPGVPPGKKPQGGLTYEPTKFAGPGKKVKEEAAKASEADKQKRPKADAPEGAPVVEAPTDKTFKPIDADNRYAAVTRVTQGMANGVPNLESENKLDEHVKDILKVFTSPQQMDILSGTYDSTSGSEEDKRYRFVATDVRVSSNNVGWSSDDTYEVDMLMFSENNGPDSQLQTGPVQQSNAMRTVTVTVLAKPNSSASNTFTLTNDFDNVEDFRAVEYFVSTVAAVSNANKIYVNDSSAQVLAQGGYVYADRSDADFASIGIFNTNLVKILRDLYPPKSEESKTLEKNIVKYTEFTPNGYVTDIDYDMILSKDVMARVKEGVDSGKVRLFEEEGKEGSNPRFVKTIGIPKTPKQIVTDKETRIKSKKELENKSGDENPVEYNKKVDFSTSEIDGLPSMLGAISEVRADTHNELGAPNPVKNRGVSAAIDGTDIEDLEVTVDEVIDEISGDASTRIIFKLTPWAANELKVDKDSDWSINPDEGGYAKLPYTAIDETTGAVIEYPEKAALRDRLTTFETEVSPGVKIQILLGPKAGSGGGFGSNSKTLASSVRIDIDKDIEVTTELLDEVFRKAGVRSPRPATLDDFKLLSENRAITVLGMGHTSPESNPVGESRKNQLENIKKKYGFDSSDITVVRSSTGRIEVRVPSKVAKKISADTGTYTLSHSANFYGFLENKFSDFTGFYSTITDQHLKAMAARTVNMLVGRNNEGGELKSSRRRFLRGLPVEGQSTQEDIQTGEGGDYVFFTPKESNDEGNLTDKYSDAKHIEFQFDPDKLYERLDFYANSGDNGTGRRERKDSVIDDAAAGGYEVMFKGAVSMDSLRSLVVNPELRPYVIEQLEARGITEINGKDIRDIVLYAGYGPDQDTRDIEKSLSNTQNTSSN